MLDTASVPGNRNADDIDPRLREFDHIAFINKTLQLQEVKAVSVFSFGFGQKGTQAIVVHPKYLFATLDEGTYNAYCRKTEQRRRTAAAEWRRRLVEGRIFVPKDVAPYSNVEKALTDPAFRVKV
jgi:fatty acid synthase subunit alpha, fungi type